MTKYGFVIDHRKCIGCHACTVACKSENQVPLGVFRTWVKYIEKGHFPNTRRYFTVERCQHCENAPCVTICPTRALFKRHDGIVDFNSDRCIGCKSCMQACPYDALYIDPDSHTAAKCNYCAHRVDLGLLPACVIVCPVKAIIAGDLDDPTSEIAQTLCREHFQVRRPDQGTRPQVFYVGADETAITPGLAAQPSQYMWSSLGPRGLDLEPKGALPDLAPEVAHSVTVYDVAHPKPWGWKVSSYLFTKSIGSGALGLAAPLLAAGLVSNALALGAGLLSGLFTLLTLALLVWDLKRPERFWRVLLTPNWRSWLVRGGYILTVYLALTLLWSLAALADAEGLLRLLSWPALLLAAAVAGYSALLFGQAEGRDFWQSPVLLWHLLGAAALSGAAALGIFALLTDPTNSRPLLALQTVLLLGIALVAGLVLAELLSPHPNKDVAAAAAIVRRGPLAQRFWLGYLLLGALLPAAILVAVVASALPPGWTVPASLLALGGLWMYEDVWVRAGQSVPMS